MQHKDRTLSQSWTGCIKMTKQTLLISFLPKPIGRPYIRLDVDDAIVCFCGGTAYGPLK
jgi:hypothetical protein